MNHPCSGAGCSQRSETRPSPSCGVRVCLMPSHSSHCLTAPSPLVTVVFGSPPFPRRLVTSPLLQTCVREVYPSLRNRPFFTHATKALSALQNKQNQPAYNTAATLDCLVLSRTQKGPGARADLLGSARQEGAVPQPGCSP